MQTVQNSRPNLAASDHNLHTIFSRFGSGHRACSYDENQRWANTGAKDDRATIQLLLWLLDILVRNPCVHGFFNKI